jgi:hypothetical protein
MDCYGISIVVGMAIQIVSGTSGTIFNVSIAGTKSPVSGVVGSISGVAYYSYIDHESTYSFVYSY